jgi:hypothetical protein
VEVELLLGYDGLAVEREGEPLSRPQAVERISR